jgi:hypothetical protein
VAIPLAAAIKGIPFLVLVVLLVGLARRQERRWLEAAAAGELGGPALTAEDLYVLEQPRRRWRARRAMRRRAGRRAAACSGVCSASSSAWPCSAPGCATTTIPT